MAPLASPWSEGGSSSLPAAVLAANDTPDGPSHSRLSHRIWACCLAGSAAEAQAAYRVVVKAGQANDLLGHCCFARVHLHCVQAGTQWQRLGHEDGGVTTECAQLQDGEGRLLIDQPLQDLRWMCQINTRQREGGLAQGRGTRVLPIVPFPMASFLPWHQTKTAHISNS